VTIIATSTLITLTPIEVNSLVRLR
jgi:hypothetical protein